MQLLLVVKLILAFAAMKLRSSCPTLQVFVAAAVAARMLLAPRCYTELPIADCRVWQLASCHLTLFRYAV